MIQLKNLMAKVQNHARFIKANLSKTFGTPKYYAYQAVTQ